MSKAALEGVLPRGHRPYLFRSSRDEGKMGTCNSGVVTVLAGVLAAGVATLAHAQAPISGLAAQADARMQAEAAVASRILAGRPAYAETGEWVGRVADVRVGPNRASLVAIVTVRPRFGWGKIAVPTSNLRQVGGRVVIPRTLAAIRAMPRLPGK
jgi:sporulation protein YlmC with PRC-barrel domain